MTAPLHAAPPPGDAHRPQTEPQRLVTLPYGHLPTLGYFLIHARLSPAEARTTLNAMRAELRRDGPTDNVRATLLLCGFTWADAPTLPDADMQEAVDSVAAALGDES